MTERPAQREIELDAIDDAFKRSIAQAYVDLTTYGVAPIRTFDDARNQAAKTVMLARRTRAAAIALVEKP